MNITDQFKKGWRTSEFWLSVVMLAAPIVAAFSDYQIDTQQLGAAIPAVVYIAGRGWLKRKRLDAIVAADGGDGTVEAAILGDVEVH